VTEVAWARTFVIAGLVFTSFGEWYVAPWLIVLGLALWWFAPYPPAESLGSTVVVVTLLSLGVLGAAGLGYAVTWMFVS
jgi:hypothetical protein